MDYVKIDGIAYDVIVTAVTEDFNILNSENAGRSAGVGSPMVLDPLGTFYGHTVTFKRKRGREAIYDQLFYNLSLPRTDGLPVEIVHGQDTIAYDAYVSTGSRALERINLNTGEVYWREFSVKFTPMEAQVASYE